MGSELNPSDWAVLGALVECPAHGFALARVLSPEGDLGRIWVVPRPVVYQVLKKLEAEKLIAGRAVESGGRGPARQVFGATAKGRRALAAWLAEPVEHVRDVRSLLLLKLALLDRSGGDRRPLVAAQRARLAGQAGALASARRRAEGFDRVLLEWRLSGTRATVGFLDALERLDGTD